MRSFSHFSPLKSFLPNLLRPPHFHHHQLMASRAARFGALVDKMQQLVQSDPLSGWEKCWEIGLTTWDLREPTPIVEHLVRNDLLPKGRALVPGCGSGYDVVTLASPDRYVIGLDLSKSAVKRAGELAATSSNGTCFSFVQADFFTWNPTELFDLIFDYTFFCAIEPKLRSAWAHRISDLLKPDGELITLMFPFDDHDGGPPYKISIADYETVLHPLGFQAISIVENELAVPSRKGREKLGRWKRMMGVSPL
ncbi:putative thiol methyltransferase 2 isoform X1 [Silene latifolia]|uniref:putative thiol methyltransferase 2 isoform X1 n=1 Tax=Silene latifolia TaxID=37657 RepID=UPI003D770249